MGALTITAHNKIGPYPVTEQNALQMGGQNNTGN